MKKHFFFFGLMALYALLGACGNPHPLALLGRSTRGSDGFFDSGMGHGSLAACSTKQMHLATSSPGVCPAPEKLDDIVSDVRWLGYKHFEACFQAPFGWGVLR